VLLAIAVLPLFRLRSFEHRFAPGPGVSGPTPDQVGAAPE